MRYLLVLIAITLLLSDAMGGPFRRRVARTSSSGTQTQGIMFDAVPVDGLDEVNAVRIAKGLKPFIRDEALSAGAMEIIKYRAKNGIIGHVMNGQYALDHQWAPGCTSAGAEGIACPIEFGWRTCLTYSIEYARAGAAYAIRPDGTRIMHLFVR